MKFFLLCILFVSPVLFAQTSYVAPTAILSKHGSQIGFTGDYFKSSTRYDPDGEEIKFEDGESFSRVQGQVAGYYGLTENLQIGGGVRYRQNASKVLNATTDDTETDTASGVESTFATLKYAFKPVDRVQYSLEGIFRFRTFTNDESDETNEGKLILGDDGNE